MSNTSVIDGSAGSAISDSSNSYSNGGDDKVISEHIRVYCRLKPEGLPAAGPAEGGNGDYNGNSSSSNNDMNNNGSGDSGGQGLYLTGADSDDARGAGDSSFLWDVPAAQCTYIPPSAASAASRYGGSSSNSTSTSNTSANGGAPPGSQTFRFNGVFGFDAAQDEVFSVVARPIVDSVLRGYSGTVLAYGPTGSGKTHTMRGGPGSSSGASSSSSSSSSSGSSSSSSASDAGIIPRCLEHILASPLAADCTVWVSYLQIYCEELHDLLLTPPQEQQLAGSSSSSCSSSTTSIPTTTPQDLQIRERDGHVFVEGLSRTPVTSLEDLNWVMQRGDANRIVAATTMNEVSSRSHAALIVSIVPKASSLSTSGSADAANKSSSGKGGKSTNTSGSSASSNQQLKERSLVLVDLSGSERASASGGKYLRLEEAKAINLSLSALGNCISALCEGRRHVPYRDSKLTRLLQGSLGGGARTAVIVTIPPSSTSSSSSGGSATSKADQSAEVISALRFAARAGRVQVSAKVQRYVDYQAMYERAQQQLDEQSAINRTLELGLAKRTERVDELEGVVDSLRMEVRSLRASLTVLEERGHSSSSTCGGGGASSDSAPSSDGSGGTISEAVEELMRRQAQDMEALRQQMEKRVAAYRSASSQAAQELSSVLLESQQDKEGYADTLRELREARGRVVDVERSANARTTELLGEVSELQRQLDDARAQAQEQASELEGLRAAVEALTERLSDAAAEIESRVPKAKVEEMEFLFSDTISRLWSRVAQLESRHKAAERASSQRLDDCGGALNFDALGSSHLIMPPHKAIAGGGGGGISTTGVTSGGSGGGAGRIRTVQQLSAAHAMSVSAGGRPASAELDDAAEGNHSTSASVASGVGAEGRKQQLAASQSAWAIGTATTSSNSTSNNSSNSSTTSGGISGMGHSASASAIPTTTTGSKTSLVGTTTTNKSGAAGSSGSTSTTTTSTSGASAARASRGALW